MRKRTHKWINGTKGAISLLMAMLMLPFYSLAAVLVESVRYQSTVKALDEVMNSSMLSGLADYDKYLQERFGLLAIDQGNGEQAIQDSFAKYLGKNQLTDVAGSSIQMAAAEGVYPLADVQVLRRQIEEQGKLLVPAKIAADGLDINDIIKSLEKSLECLNILEHISNGFSLISAQAETLKSVENTVAQAGVVRFAGAKYDSSFEALKEKVQSLKDHLDTACPDASSDPSGAQTWEDQKAELVKQVTAAVTGYKTTVEELIKALDKFENDIDTTMSKAGSFLDKAASMAGSHVEGTQTGLSKEEQDGLETTIDGINTMTGSMERRLKKLMDEVDTGALVEASSKLNQEKKDLGNYQPENLTASTAMSSLDPFHQIDYKTLVNITAFQTVLSETAADTGLKAVIEWIKARLDMLKSLLNVRTFYDPELNCQLDIGYYTDQIGGLPSYKNRSSPAYSLNSGYGEDAKKSQEILKEIDPNYDPEQPFGVDPGFDPDLIPRMVENMGKLSGDLMSLSFSGLSPLLSIYAIANLVPHIQAVINDVTTFAKQWKQQVTNLPRTMYSRLLVNGYLAYNLPNRTNYVSADRGTTGYAKNKILYGEIPNDSLAKIPSGSNMLIALGDAVRNHGGFPAKNFAGAELEYIVWGTNSELANQALQFFVIFMMRMVMDLGIFADPEVQAIAAASTIAYPLVLILQLITEALADTWKLVNGGSAKLVKMKAECTPTGFPKLLEEIKFMKVVKGAQSTKTEEKSEEPEQGKNPLKKAFQYNYTEHTLFYMLLLGNEQRYLQRFMDLIQAECTMHQQYSSDLGDRVSGSVQPFDLDKAYTFIRGEVSGELVPLLPLPEQTGKAAPTVKRVLYRGY